MLVTTAKKLLILFLFSTLLSISCGKKQANWIKVDPAFIPYISGYTGGIVSTATKIRVQLAQEINTTVEFGTFLKDDFFSFEPNIKGRTRWIDASTIEFVPEERLPSGILYTAHFKLADVIKVPEKLKDFAFSFKTIQQSGDLQLKYPETYDANDYTKQYIDGIFITADKVGLDSVKKCFTIRQNNQPLQVNWSQSKDQKSHFLRIENITRSATESTVNVRYDGTSIGSEENQNEARIIPPLGTFKVDLVKAVNGEEPHIALHFTDPLLEMQDVEGLISIAGSNQLSTMIEGHTLIVYKPENEFNTSTIQVNEGIQNSNGQKLLNSTEYNIAFTDVAPDVRFAESGNILPQTKGIVVPFEAVNLNKVDVQIIQIFPNNIPQFLQYNSLNGDDNLLQVGKIILRKTIPLETKNIASRGRYAGYGINIDELIKTEPGAIYNVSLKMRPSYSTYPCDGAASKENELEKIEPDNKLKEMNAEGYYGTYNYDYEENYDFDWRDRENPCKATFYYQKRAVGRNILVSDIGLMAKKGTGDNWQFITTDIQSGAPMSNVKLEVLDFQNQVIAKLSSDNNGIATLNEETASVPHLVAAKKGKQSSYLLLKDGNAINLSSYDVSGDGYEQSVKGFIYGERGVWRPGDSIFVDFILNDKQQPLEEGFPIVMEVMNPKGQLVKKLVSPKENGKTLYAFPFQTDDNAPTGNYTANISIGSNTFTKTLKVETVMPNRLKIDFKIPNNELYVSNSNQDLILKSNWLFGSPAKQLRANVGVVLSESSTEFKNFKEYIFDDASRRTNPQEVTVFDGLLNDNGEALVKPIIRTSAIPAGKLKADFTVRVFEQGGSFSIDRFSVPYFPFNSYAGVKVPKGEGWANILGTNKNHLFNLACVDDKGKPLSGKTLTVNVYKLEYEWWWQRSELNVSEYYNAEYAQPVKTEKLISGKNGIAALNLKFEDDEWGTYLFRVCDETSGHCASTTFNIDNDEWMNRGGNMNKSAQSITLKSSKSSYFNNEEISITFPSPAGAKALISIEDGSGVLESYWINTTANETNYRFKAKAEYAPNIYTSVCIIQPYSRNNDLPIRLYGTLPIIVEDKNSHLKPIIEMPETIRPESTVQVNVSESSGKPMEYTLAIVDEGLLDLTRFQTPDPWKHFNAKEPLGVITWDLYDDIMGAYGGQLESVLSIGGDGTGKGKKPTAKASRFKPMVRVLGPFKLSAGKKGKHMVSIPNYFGSCRVMVVASNENGAYGATEKTVSIKKPLMILATLPRIVSPGESVKLPVNIFALDKLIKNVKVNCVASGNLILNGNTSQSITITGNEALAYFDINSALMTGNGKVKLTATSGKESATAEIEIEVRSPNPEITEVSEIQLKPGEIYSGAVNFIGMAGTQSASLELSTMPAINLGARLKYLIQYPHGCAEQTTSAAFPQLFLEQLVTLSEGQKKRTSANIKTAINKLYQFQTSNGGFAYWPGKSEAEEWVSSYVGHFLLKAQESGYSVSTNSINRWKKYQQKLARTWRPTLNKIYTVDPQVQSYRLLTLALCNAAELGAMNRLKESKTLNSSAKNQLAMAYQLAGQNQTAITLLQQLSTNNVSTFEYYFDNNQLSDARLLQSLTSLGKKKEAVVVARKVAAYLGSKDWMSTVSAANCIMAMADFIKNENIKRDINYEYTFAGKTQKGQSLQPAVQLELPVSAKNSFTFKNNGKGTLFLRIIRSGIPGTNQNIAAASSGITMQVAFKDGFGKALNVSDLTQGTDFTASVTISNSSNNNISNLALNTMFADGWEINNSRINDALSAETNAAFDYQDIRDDKVKTYFSLGKGASKTFTFKLNAAYLGKFYLPSFQCSAMYDNTIFSRTAAAWVNVNSQKPPNS
jgi:uncharacterized protein YfaS (alpha-2-macroglobulin family)